jgi:hypothetical protein
MSWGLLLGLGLFACSAQQPTAANTAGKGGTALSTPPAGAANNGSASSTASPVLQPSASTSGSSAGSGAVVPANNTSGEPLNCNQVNSPFKVEGCACTAGQTSACWTGFPADRNQGKCHDGLQVCEGTTEFASWGPCMGEVTECGADAGVPETNEECGCIPGAVIQCSEDCSVGIICSLTATKTCLPDGSWSTCKEDLGVQLDAPGFQCRNMLHGCLQEPQPDGRPGAGEIFVGDCSTQFKCGSAPPPPPPPVLPE